ncbi:MAG TPA: hypothetical protein VJ896_01845 [Bacteroidales bacterium]|nr:hypothetical protein [Bacteroidales bacterium]
MKRKILLLLTIIATVTICISCTTTAKCPAYAQKSTPTEQNS